jgi:hypothetical protein
MSTDDQIAIMHKLRHILDLECLDPLDRKAVIIFLTANYVISTNEILFGGDAIHAQKIISNLHENIIRMVDYGIKSGGMRLEGIMEQ